MKKKIRKSNNRVLIVTNIPAPYRVDFFRFLQNNCKKEIHVLFASKGESNRQWGSDLAGLVNVHYQNSKQIVIKRRYDNKYIYLPSNLSKQLKQINPDVIIAWEYNPVSLLSFFWCRFNGKRFISLTDGTLRSERTINFFQKLNRRIMIKHCDAAIASSTKAKEKLLHWGIEERKVFLSLLTEDLTPFKTINRSPMPGRLLYVGSLIQRKGLDLLINALPLVKSEWNLNVVGNGTPEEKSALIELANTAEIIDRVSFLGYKEGKDLLDEYQKASVFVFPTREDCFGLVLLEAAAANVPIVTSIYADGAYDVIQSDKGLFVDPENAEEMAAAIEKALQESVYGKEMSANDNIYSKFSFENVMKGFFEAIDFAELV
ncbi:MAG: glycosyltransferase family 4 protein [Lachnospiraceae bacterium]|nr:glycosyltransferase family 4 protein [Lachnospiraceae bacterium]